MPDNRKRPITLKPRDVALAAKIVSGMPVEKAKQEVGIFSHKMTQNQKNIIEAMREEMQKRPGHTFEDAAEFYLETALGKKKRKMVQLIARARHDKIMGYDAPAKVEVHERKELSQAVLVLHAIAGKTGLSPAQLFNEIKEVRDGTAGTKNTESERSETTQDA